jgi:hypothetical protein
MASCSTNNPGNVLGPGALTSAFIDLATYDEMEKYMYGGKDSQSYFVKETKKTNWFTQIPVCLNSVGGLGDFNNTYTVSISRAGDYLTQVWLKVLLPEVELKVPNATRGFLPPDEENFSGYSGATFPPPPATGVGLGGNWTRTLRWSKNVGINLIQEANITFNDMIVARFDNYHLDFWNSFYVPPGKREIYNEMIGNIPPLNNPRGVNNGFNNTQNFSSKLPATCLNIPLPFFFTRDPSLALPTASLPYTDMKINITFRDWTQLLIIDNYIGGTTWPKPPSTGPTQNWWYSTPATIGDISRKPQLSKVCVYANYAIVSNEERKQMGSMPRDILIEQAQNTPLFSYCPYENKKPCFNIRFANSVKNVYFAVRNCANPAAWSNYTDNPQYPLGPINGGSFAPPGTGTISSQFGTVDYSNSTYTNNDPIGNFTLNYENNPRFSNLESDYFSQVGPFYSANAVPLTKGLHTYTYAMDPYGTGPGGSTNYGKLTNVEAIPEATDQAVASCDPSLGAVSSKYEFMMTATNYNIVRISGGSLGFPVL